MANKKHEWEVTDNQGHSMQCSNCELSIYFEEGEHWDENIDAQCPGKPL